MPAPQLGRFHEISVSTRSLEESLAFYLALGWQRGEVEPVWPHPYAVVSLGPLVIGLHEYRFPSPSVTCVHTDIRGALDDFRDSGAIIAFAKTGADCFNEFGLRDPAGHMITLLERPTHLVEPRPSVAESAQETITGNSPGKALAFSLPSAAREISAGFWQAIGASADGEPTERFPAARLNAAGLPLGIHDEDWFSQPALVFQRGGLAERWILESPEGLALMVLPG